MVSALNVTDYICRYEEGDISEREYYELFQYLVDSGMAWKLQGFYGRQAAMMLEGGHLTHPDDEEALESNTEPSTTIVKAKQRRGGRKSTKQVGALVKMGKRKVPGLGMIIKRVEDVPHDGHEDYPNIIKSMHNDGLVGWGVQGSKHHNFVLVQWFEAPSEYSSEAVTRTKSKQWYPDKWVTVVSSAPKRGIYNEA